MAPDPFNLTSIPLDLASRERRVQAIAEFCGSVLAGVPPSAETSIYIASALKAYLESEDVHAELARDFLRIKAHRGSTTSVQMIYRRVKISDKD